MFGEFNEAAQPKPIFWEYTYSSHNTYLKINFRRGPFSLIKGSHNRVYDFQKYYANKQNVLSFNIMMCCCFFNQIASNQTRSRTHNTLLSNLIADMTEFTMY